MQRLELFDPSMDEYDPALHGKHKEDDFKPKAVEYLPAEQFWHLSGSPSDVEKEPGRHRMQVDMFSAPSSVEKDPALHSIHETELIAPLAVE